MLIRDFRRIGNRLLQIRKRLGLTQMEVAELAGTSDRTYADIERGSVNMRMETVLRLCEALHITPDDILTEEMCGESVTEEEVLAKLAACSPKERETALRILDVYLNSLNE